MKLHIHKFGLAGAIVAAAFMLLMSILSSLGFYTNAAQGMMNWHMFYTPNAVGTLLGMIEAAIITYVVLYALAWAYNRLLA